MNRPPKGILALGILLLASAFLSSALFWRRPQSTIGSRPTSPSSPHPATTPQTSPTPSLAELRQEIESAERSGALPKLAAEWRDRCRSDRSFIRSLARILLDRTQSSAAREVAAFVLGSLDDPEAWQALLDAIRQGGEAAWIRTLILAIGSAYDRGRDDTFSLTGGPNVVKTPTGLSVEIRKVIADPGLRSAVQGCLEHSDREVRRAALQVLKFTLVSEALSRREGDEVELGTLRDSFVLRMIGDEENSLRAEAGHSLAEWLVTAPVGSRGHGQVLDSLFHKSLESGEEQLRFRTLQGLKQAELAGTQLEAVRQAALRGADFDQRAWAIELLGAHGESFSAEQRRDFVSSILQDADPKIRETGLRQLTALPPDDQLRDLARNSLGDPAWNVRYAAVAALGTYAGTPDLVRALEDLSRSDPQPEVRALATKTLQTLKRP